jgi:hypothetical protein
MEQTYKNKKIFYKKTFKKQRRSSKNFKKSKNILNYSQKKDEAKINTFYFTFAFQNKKLIEPNIIYPDFGIFEKLLLKHKFKKIWKNPYSYVTIVLAYLPLKSFKVDGAKLYNYLNAFNIANKELLYTNCINHDKNKTNEFIPLTYIFNLKELSKESLDNKILQYETIINNYPLWVIKTDTGQASKGNYLVNNFESFKKTTNEIYESMDKLIYKNRMSNGFILSQYIMNPLLFQKKKFHLRNYVIAYINSEKILKFYLSKYGKITVAESEYSYSPNDYLNPSVQYTIGVIDKKEYIFPKDYINEFGVDITNKTLKQIKDIVTFTFEVSKGKIFNYENIENGYIILGYDFIIDDNLNVKLLEINSKSDLNSHTTELHNTVYNYLFKNIYNEIFCDIFKFKKIYVNEKLIEI